MKISIILFLIFLGIIIHTVYNRIKEKLSNSINSIVDNCLDYFNWKIALYKRKSREYFNHMEIMLEEDEEFREEYKSLKFEDSQKNKDTPFEWRIIKIDRNLDKDRIEKSVILDLPSHSKFLLERQIMELNYRDALFFVLQKILARELNKTELIAMIDDRVDKRGINREFQTMFEILSNKYKRLAMLEEARRKYHYASQGMINSAAKREYSRFLEDLTKNTIGIYGIAGLPPEQYLIDVKNLLSKYSILHIYARGERYVKCLVKLSALIKKKMSAKVTLEDIPEYDWDDPDSTVKYKAKTIIIRRK